MADSNSKHIFLKYEVAFKKDLLTNLFRQEILLKNDIEGAKSNIHFDIGVVYET